METELRRELEEQASRVREAEGRGEKEQARLRSELRSKETAYKVKECTHGDSMQPINVWAS